MAWNDGLENNTPTYSLASSDADTIRSVAGPGSGKTFALIRRIIRLLESAVDPKKILAITFTRNASNDLKKEILQLETDNADKIVSHTLHSHALGILMHAEVLERTNRAPRMVIPHEILPALYDMPENKYGSITEKRKLLTEYLAGWAKLQTDTPGFVKNQVQGDFETELVQWLINHQGILVGEVIPVALNYLRNNPASSEIGKYDHILVDEYQDLNRSEQEFIKLIRGGAKLLIVGDDDQSIYSFKHAHPDGIRQLDTVHGVFDDIPFSECRRCPTKVTTLASALISKNPHRTLGNLTPKNGNNEGIVNIIQWSNYEEELQGLKTIIVQESKKVAYKDILILAPRRKIGYRLRDLLLAEGIPVKSYFREDVITNDTVKRAYSLMSIVAFPQDSITLRYLLGFNSADYRKNQYLNLTSKSNELGVPINEVLNKILRGDIPDTNLKTITEEYRKMITDSASLKAAFTADWANGFQNYFIKTDEDESNFYELNQIYKSAVNEVGEYVTGSNFDDWFKKVFEIIQIKAALLDSPEETDQIKIMSLHSSKGLSAKLVVLCSMIDHLMPYIPDDLPPEEIPSCVEEQRRLFYVAITRCKTMTDYPGQLIISSFLSIYGLEAARMGIKCNPQRELKVSSTRYITDFGATAPTPVLGDSLINTK